MGMYNIEDPDKIVPAKSRDKTHDLERQVKQFRESIETLTKKLDESNQKISRLSTRVRQLETQIANIKRQ